jgi:hypothetical protein
MNATELLLLETILNHSFKGTLSVKGEKLLDSYMQRRIPLESAESIESIDAFDNFSIPMELV